MFSLIGAHVTALKAAQPLRGGVTLRDDVSEGGGKGTRR